jgi:protein-disulfide isomerase
MRFLWSAAVAAFIGFAGAATAADDLPDLTREQIEQIVHDYLLANPSVVVEALQTYQAQMSEAQERTTDQAMSDMAIQLYGDPETPETGNPDGDVVIVEFFDYRCGYCRRVVDSMRALVDRDENLRVVFKEFPILGEDSVRASRAALAADRQGLYLPLHFALMAADDLSMEGIMQAAAGVGLDTEQLATDMQSPDIQAEIGATYALARELGIEGTPAFVVGDELVPGAVSEERLASLIEAARTN